MANAVDISERYVQVLAVLRAAEGAPVPRSKLVALVPAYSALKDDFVALKKLMQNDHKALTGMGFLVEDVAGPGELSRFVLVEGSWRLPVHLSAAQQGLLAWVTAAAWATTAERASSSDVTALVGDVPRELDAVQVALATGRSLVVLQGGDPVVLHPGLLAARGGRWFVIGRYDGERRLRAHRVDRLQVEELGEPMTTPVVVGDPEEVLDATAWDEHIPYDAELRCRLADLAAVLSWFPRAEVEQDGDEAVLRFWYRNEEALVSRVVGLAGAVRVVAPEQARRAVVAQVEAVLQAVGA